MKIIPCDNDSNTLWLVTSLFPYPGHENKYVVYKIYNSVVSYQGAFDMGPSKQIIPGSYGAGTSLNIVYTKANTTAGITNVGFALQYTSSVFTCQFDNINGQFLTSTIKEYDTGLGAVPAVYDLEFSPGGRFLYYCVQGNTPSYGNNLYQIDLQDTIYSPVLINNHTYRYSGGLALGPDSLIYHIYDSGYDSQIMKLGRILQPDVKYIPGTTVYNLFYQENFQTYNNVLGTNFCEFLILPNTNFPSDIPILGKNLNSFNIYPNPSSNNITVDIPEKSIIEISSVQGQLIKTFTTTDNKTNIDVSNFTKGVYIVRIISNSGIFNKKFIVE